MTTTDHAPENTKPTSHAKATDQQLANVGNVATAVGAIGLSVACGLLLSETVNKVLVGIAVVVAVVAIGTLVYRRFVKADQPTVEETKAVP